ncbi:hypothetical protein C7271_03585 [filamentous cyanobacterium CCP5]|nr:hypothetical protein C7271_03585 [filamentous cyanobacterium CCP5]
MGIEFIEIEIDLSVGTSLVADIEAALGERGEPLRWAIAAVNPDTQTAHVEAVVTVETVVP